MDLAAILGLFAGFGLIATAIFMGGAPQAFFDLPAILIVFGGTFAVTTIPYSFRDVLHAQNAVMKAVFRRALPPEEAATRVLELAEIARRKGSLALQSIEPEYLDHQFLSEGVSMVVDGSNGDEIEKVLSEKINAIANRHAKSVNVIRKAAEVSPAMGLIGTLVGLVQMLGNLDDPSSIGPSMAVALLTTFYGAVLSNMVFSPLATKLERNSAEEALLNTIYITGVTSIGRQENPRRLEMLINTLLPPAQRVHVFD